MQQGAHSQTSLYAATSIRESVQLAVAFLVQANYICLVILPDLQSLYHLHNVNL